MVFVKINKNQCWLYQIVNIVSKREAIKFLKQNVALKLWVENAFNYTKLHMIKAPLNNLPCINKYEIHIRRDTIDVKYFDI